MNKRVNELQKFIGFSDEAFSKKIGIETDVLKQITSGTRNVPEQVVDCICKEFGVSNEWLRTGKGTMLVPTLNDKFSMTVGEILKSDNDDFKKLVIKLWEDPEMRQRLRIIDMQEARHGSVTFSYDNA